MKKYLKEAPGSFVYKMLRKKNITLNGKKADGTEKLQARDEISLFLAEDTLEKFCGKTEKTKYPLKKLDILFEDENLLVLNKPAGELSQKAEKTDVSMNEYALGYLLETKAVTEESLQVYKPSICNRLDRNTSGILLIAKTYQGARVFGEALQRRSLGKYYSCIVLGSLTKSQEVHGYLKKDEKKNQVRIYQQPVEGAAKIHTGYVPLKNTKDLTLLEVHLITGKTHQIRGHLSSIGHPILGDPKYGDNSWNEKYGVKRQLLHACRLEMNGFSGEFAKYNGLTITAPVPEKFSKIMKQ